MNHKVKKLLDELGETSPEATWPKGLEDAIIGTVERNCLPIMVLLDKDKCVDILMARDGMTYREAEDWLDYNVIGTYLGEGTACFATLIDEADGPIHGETK